jgi:hypothetical protein
LLPKKQVGPNIMANIGGIITSETKFSPEKRKEKKES